MEIINISVKIVMKNMMLLKVNKYLNFLFILVFILIDSNLIYKLSKEKKLQVNFLFQKKLTFKNIYQMIIKIVSINYMVL